MQFQVQLFIRAHHHGFYTVEVLGEPSLTIYTDDLDQAREDLALVLGDRFERMHPRLLGRYAEADGLHHVVVGVGGALVVDTEDGPAPQETKASVLVGADRRWWRLHAPRWDLRAWVPRSEDAGEAAARLLSARAETLDEPVRLPLRYEGKEWLEPLVVEAQGATPAQFTGTWRSADFLPEPGPVERDGERETPEGARNKKTRPATPTLRRVAVALHTQAAEGELERAHGRDGEVHALLEQIRHPGAWVVVGERGVGKTTVLNELAQRLHTTTRHDPLGPRPVFFIDASRLIAGEGGFGDWQQQCLDVVSEAIEAEVVLYLGDVLALLDAGKSAHSDQNVALLLKPFLAGRRMTVLAEATTASWAKVELRDAGFARLFSPYRLDTPDAAGVTEILAAVGAELAEETGLTLLPEALAAVDELSTRFRGDGARLGQAVQFLRRLVDDAAFQAEQAEGDAAPPPLGRSAVVARLCAETGMPAFLVQDDVPLDPAEVRAHFRQRLIGQDDAVQRMTDLVALMKAGLSDLNRPLGSFLFVGPTGVGKTEMAKALAAFLFGRPDRLIRFDMSEFVRSDSVHRFMGDAGEEGLLISQVRRQPFCVLLLDEVEKAHPAVFDVLLQVLGEARLTDQAGRTADFRNTVVLMTSNLGVDTFRRRPGFGRAPTADAFRGHFLAEAERFFRPELFNRLDHIVPFMPLGAEAIDRITGRALSAFLAREGLRQRGIELTLSPAVHQWIAQRGVAPRYGARPLKRLIEAQLTAPLARHLAGRHIGGAHGVTVQPEGEALVFASVEGAGHRGLAGARKAARAFLSRVGVLRWQVQQWLDAAPFREAHQAVRLIDRLANQPHFWNDRTVAEARTRAAQRDRELVTAMRGLNTQLAGVEDLAYEAFYDRDAAALPELEPELTRISAQLNGLELGLLARAYENADQVLLYLKASEDGAPLLRSLVDAYTWLAQQRGWRLAVCSAMETPWAHQAREQREAKLRNTTKKTDKDAAPTPIRATSLRHLSDPRAWAWSEWQALQTPDDPQDERGLRKARTRLTNLAMGADDTAMRVLRLEGPQVAVLLSHEAGEHIATGHAGGANPTVRVHPQPSRLKRRNPTELVFLRRKRRLLEQGKRLVTDPILGLSMPMGTRLGPRYLRCMRAALYDGVFGAGSHKLFAREQPSTSGGL